MAPDDVSLRWVDALSALRTEHLGRLHGFSSQSAFGVLAVALAIFVGVVLSLDPLWDLSLDDSIVGWPLAFASAAAFTLAGALLALALHQQRRDRSAAIAALDRAIPQLVAGADPHGVLAELSERMKRIAPPRGEGDASPYLPTLLAGRWLGSTFHTKVCLALALVLLASFLLAQALVLSVPPGSGDEFDDGPPAAGSDDADARDQGPLNALLSWGSVDR